MTTCDHCDRTIWSEEVHDDGYVFCSTDCRDAEKDEQTEDAAWADMTLSQQREAMGGPNGGDGDED